MLRFSGGSDAMCRLPRHPDWKYEMVKGEAWLSSRPRPLLLCRSTSLAVPAVTLSGVEVRTTDARRDHSEISKLLMDVWVDEDPYRSLEDPEATLQPQIQRSLEDPGLGVIAIDAQGVCATALVPSMVQTLSTRGVDELASGTSAANIASLRWHLTRGFQLAPDPIREALRR